MITIDQLLESVDLDFEPRWVTMNAFGVVAVRSGEKPHPESPKWIGEIREYEDFGKLKLAEFADKDWQECIYEVPRKTTGKIEHFFNECGDDIVDEEEYQMTGKAIKKLNLLVDAVNELKGAKNE